MHMLPVIGSALELVARTVDAVRPPAQPPAPQQSRTADMIAQLQSAGPGAGWLPWSASRARSLPGVGRALGLYCGLAGQMPLTRSRGGAVLPPGRLLQRPDPARGSAWFIARHMEDYLVHGNAITLVTVRDDDGWPAAVAWLPAHRVTLTPGPDSWAPPVYLLDGRPLPADDVIHVQRGADPDFPWRGIGVIEQHLQSLGRVYRQEAFESANMQTSGVPSVAIIANNPRLSDEEIDQARGQWDALYGGATRRPGIFPQGTVVTPLSWSPTDAQLTEARQFSLVDVSNMFNLDGLWLGAPASSHTYRTVAPAFTHLVRAGLQPILVELEQEWGYRWLPRGQVLSFDRRRVEQGTLSEAVETISRAMTTIGADQQPLMSTDEARTALDWALTPAARGGTR